MNGQRVKKAIFAALGCLGVVAVTGVDALVALVWMIESVERSWPSGSGPPQTVRIDRCALINLGASDSGARAWIKRPQVPLAWTATPGRAMAFRIKGTSNPSGNGWIMVPLLVAPSDRLPRSEGLEKGIRRSPMKVTGFDGTLARWSDTRVELRAGRVTFAHRGARYQADADFPLASCLPPR